MPLQESGEMYLETIYTVQKMNGVRSSQNISTIMSNISVKLVVK